MTGTAAEHGTDLQLRDSCVHDFMRFVGIDQLVPVNDDLAGFRMPYRFERVTAFDPVVQIFDNLFAVLNHADGKAFIRTAIFLAHDNVLSHVDETAGQITGVRRPQRGIGQTFPRAVRRNEVFQDREAFAEVRFDRKFDDAAGRVGHEAPHTAQLGDLRFVPRALESTIIMMEL